MDRSGKANLALKVGHAEEGCVGTTSEDLAVNYATAQPTPIRRPTDKKKKIVSVSVSRKQQQNPMCFCCLFSLQ